MIFVNQNLYNDSIIYNIKYIGKINLYIIHFDILFYKLNININIKKNLFFYFFKHFIGKKFS